MTRTRLLAPLALVALLAGCAGGAGTDGASSSAPAASADATDTPSAASPSGGDQASQPGGGGVSGLVAYVSDGVMQVQDQDMQTAVSWTADTVVTAEVSGTLADVVAGACVVATGATPANATGGGGTTPSTDDAASATATRVAISQPVDGQCAATGFPGGPGGFAVGSGGARDGLPTDLPTDLPEGVPTAMPEGMPTDLPTDFPSGGTLGDGARMLGLRTGGVVTAVDGSTITVETTAADGTATPTTITVDATTTYTKAVASDASAIVVGQCVAARGEADSSGQVAATSLTLSAPVDGACTSFGRTRTGTMRGGGTTGAGTTGAQGGSDA